MNSFRAFVLFVVFMYGSAFVAGNMRGFEESQKDFERVRAAYRNKETHFNELCVSKGISPTAFGNIFIRVFKHERILELWVQKTDNSYVMLSEYNICKISGKLGPKRAQGDLQVPEGCYTINVFNPQSLYNLSLGINYPNESDRIISKASNRGGDIYIHGECASIGCVAMDEWIQEIYIAAVKAKNQNQDTIAVHIFPFKMSFKNFEQYCAIPQYKQYRDFWRNLSLVYWYFEKSRQVPEVQVDRVGKYQFSNETAISK